MNIKQKKISNPIIIRKGLKLGELDAEADRDLLLACFVDKGELHRLLNINDPASVIVGRTGAGKSALLQRISESEQHSTLLDPHDISIKFLESSNIIQFLNELGVKLDLFYRMLWRHILTVEFIKMRYQLTSEDQNRSFLARINEFLTPNPAKKKAFQYFSEWGSQFWLKADEQLREITKKFSTELSGNLAGKLSNIELSARGAKALSEEERSEVVTLATRVINEIQIQRLNEVLEVLGEYSFNDPQKRYYILIDQLDEDWAESETRCRFIKALIEETKSLRKIPQTKVISALRIDLLEVVFDSTRGAGFQEEKYESYLVPLHWTKDDLKELIELRVREVFRRQYSSDAVSLDDIFPSAKKGGQGTAIDYITERTLLRPRDVLQFVNIVSKEPPTENASLGE